MEGMLIGDGQLTPTPIGGGGVGVFPEEVIPFPDPEEPSRLFYNSPGDHHHHHHPHPTAQPPQKLRPIRRINGSDSSSELGFLPFQQQQQHDMGNGSLAVVEDDTSAAELVKIKSEMDANFISAFKSQISHLHFSFSTDSTGKAQEPDPSKKPKRKKRKKLESFLETLMAQVIQKQEQMHQQLMEMIEKKEKERIAREEAWRQQELERAKREEETRAHEATRNLALISFIQKALGQDIGIPPPPSPSPEEDEFETSQSQEELSKRWPMSEVQALITLRTALDHKFRTTVGPKAPVWEEVSSGMANMGFIRNAKKCREKWENINKYYFKKAGGNGKNHSENSAKSCPYFHELESLYRNQLITTGKPNSPMCSEDAERYGTEVRSSEEVPTSLV